MTTDVQARERTFRGEPAIELVAGESAAIFLPDLGLTGVSLRYRGGEYLALPGGLEPLRGGHTTGLPLLSPWANRLSARHYRVGRTSVDLEGMDLTVDPNGLPIHGLLVGRPGWSVDQLTTRRDTARLRASIVVDAPAFPFAHRVEVTAIMRDAELQVDTKVMPTGRRSVPVSVGWHPYLRLPGEARRAWRLQLPARDRLVTDEFLIPTGDESHEPAEAEPIAGRTFDNGYRLARVKRFALVSDAGRSIEMRCGAGYPFAQVWVPKGKSFAAFEPMTAPTNALVEGTAPLVPRGESFTATFTLTFDQTG